MSGDLTRLDPRIKLFNKAPDLKTRIEGWKKKDRLDLLGGIFKKVKKAVAPYAAPFPQRLHIEVTNACNLECVMCPRQKMERPVGKMSLTLYERIVEQLADHRRHVEGVALMGLGEPLLHPSLERMSAIAKDAGLANVYTSTNAVLLDEKRARTLLMQGRFDTIIFSLDGIEPATFNSIRKGADFEAVYENVERFLRLKQGVATPKAVLQILVLSETEDQIEKFCLYWLDKIGPEDEILIKRVDTFGGLVPERVDDAEPTPEQRSACPQLWKDMSIAWDGRVTVCCKDVFYILEIGNIKDDKIVDLWKCEKWEALRKAHLLGMFAMDPCYRCREWHI